MKLVTSPTGNISARYKDANGKWRSTNLRTTDKREAAKIAEELKIAELEDSGKLGILSREVVAKIVGGRDVKYSAVTDEFMEFQRMQAASENTLHTYTLILSQFARDYNYLDKGISSVREADVYAYINCEHAGSAANRRLRKATLSSFFKFACARTYLMANPAALVRVDASKMSHGQKEVKKRVPFTAKEFRKIWKSGHEFFAPAAALSYCTGLRLGDICSLEWESLSPEHIIVWTEKRDKRVQIPIRDKLFGNGLVEEAISGLPMVDDTYVFPEWRDMLSNPTTRAKPSVYFCRLLYTSGIPLFPNTPKSERKSFHCLRHSFITRLAREGVSLEDIGKAVGHSNVETTAGYAH